MSNSFFRFKKFTVHHDKCAMKVGTDGVLLGAWARIDGGESVLDVGTGSGLIALMMMQRGAQSVVGIDIEDTAVEQAQINVGQSIWSNSVRIEKADFISFATDENFDVIVSNPPFYKNALSCPDPLRDRARNADSLPFCQLAKKAAVLLSDGGRLSVIVPAENALDCICEALSEGLRLSRRLDVKATGFVYYCFVEGRFGIWSGMGLSSCIRETEKERRPPRWGLRSVRGASGCMSLSCNLSKAGRSMASLPLLKP